MKRILFCMVCFFMVSSIFAQRDTLFFSSVQDEADSIEYELIVIDPGYDSYLLMQPSAEFYSQSYYESWNQRYVQEWNYRHLQPMVYGDMYETYVGYDHFVDYGLELNYKLYYYFKFFEKKNDVDLLPKKVH